MFWHMLLTLTCVSVVHGSKLQALEPRDPGLGVPLERSEVKQGTSPSQASVLLSVKWE